nr:MAG TPA: hypothetical protein [Caudoviricetes sp.]
MDSNAKSRTLPSVCGHCIICSLASLIASAVHILIPLLCLSSVDLLDQPVHILRREAHAVLPDLDSHASACLGYLLLELHRHRADVDVAILRHNAQRLERGQILTDDPLRVSRRHADGHAVDDPFCAANRWAHYHVIVVRHTRGDLLQSRHMSLASRARAGCGRRRRSPGVIALHRQRADVAVRDDHLGHAPERRDLLLQAADQAVVGGVVDRLLAQLTLHAAQPAVDVLVHVQHLAVSVGVGVAQFDLGLQFRDSRRLASFVAVDRVILAASAGRCARRSVGHRHHRRHVRSRVAHAIAAEQVAERTASVEDAERSTGNAQTQTGPGHAFGSILFIFHHAPSFLPSFLHKKRTCTYQMHVRFISVFCHSSTLRIASTVG